MPSLLIESTDSMIISYSGSVSGTASFNGKLSLSIYHEECFHHWMRHLSPY